MPSLSSTSSVFGRFAAKKSVPEPQQQTPSEGAGGGTGLPTSIPAPLSRTRSSSGHRREGSVLSLTNVTELGQSVKRSVSLRSHRSQPSAASNSFGHKSRSSSSAIPFIPTFPNSPTEESTTGAGDTSVLSSSASPPPLRRSRSRGKLSLSARTLSSKFSSQSLSTFSQADSLDTAIHRPTTAVEVRKIPSSSMLPLPPAPKRAPPDRPPVPPPPPPFVPDTTANATNSNNSSFNSQHGLYLQGTATPVPHHASAHDPKAVYKQIHETSSKRIATIEYLRKVHEGNIFYFSAVHYSPVSLQSIPSMHPLKLGRRATNYFVLGYSLPALLDLNSSNPLDYLRALTTLLQEFETYQNLMGVDSSGNSLSRGRVGNMFKIGSRAKPGRRSSAATDSISLPASDLLNLPKSAGGGEAVSPLDNTPSPISPVGHDFQHLVTPHLPFDPDFTAVYATLCDTMIDTYAKLMDLVPTPEVCSPAIGDAFAKVDKTIRKILISNVVREFEESARANVKTEVAGLGKLVLGGLM